MNQVPPSATAQPTALDGATHDSRILIVDDDEFIRGLYEVVLNLVGYGTEVASNGEEALAALASGGFELVLTDCKMPRLDGIHLVRALRAAGNSIPVMMVSGSVAGSPPLPDDVTAEIAVALPKPAKTSEILAGVERALRSRRVAVAPAVQDECAFAG